MTRLACFLSTMLAGLTLSTSAPRASSAFTFSRATSSGMTMALNDTKWSNAARLAHKTSCLTGIITSGNVVGDRVHGTRTRGTHRARAIVAIEIPVEPTVPSKIREPV